MYKWSGTMLITQEIVTKQLFLAIFESPLPSPSFWTVTSQISFIFRRFDLVVFQTTWGIQICIVLWVPGNTSKVIQR